ncbi:hypothetical protein [Anaerocolumna sp.]|uniref:hypothetical protein n=1 Tax=Anaerocolumna sp. TaxID=2041569 RepID=UPI0028AB647D|nr:hypothetical protein [Anaerocolumna sp.]
MKMKGTFVYLGTETFTSQKQPDKVFKNACFLQGTDTLKVFLNEESEVLLAKIQNMETIDCVFDLKIGQKTYVSLTAVEKFQPKVV